jgi:pentatricopeptide repeat protein
VTYGIVINTYAKLGDTLKAIHWFEAMVAVRPPARPLRSDVVLPRLFVLLSFLPWSSLAPTDG